MCKGIKKMKNNKVEHTRKSIPINKLSIRMSVRSLLIVCYNNQNGKLMRNPYPFGNIMCVHPVCQI